MYLSHHTEQQTPHALYHSLTQTMERNEKHQREKIRAGVLIREEGAQFYLSSTL